MVMVGFPLTPSPLDTLMPVPAVMVRSAHVSVPVRAGVYPVPVNASMAARSLASVKTKVPDVVIGLPEIVKPAAGAVVGYAGYCTAATTRNAVDLNNILLKQAVKGDMRQIAPNYRKRVAPENRRVAHTV